MFFLRWVAQNFQVGGRPEKQSNTTIKPLERAQNYHPPLHSFWHKAVPRSKTHFCLFHEIIIFTPNCQEPRMTGSLFKIKNQIQSQYSKFNKEILDLQKNPNFGFCFQLWFSVLFLWRFEVKSRVGTNRQWQVLRGKNTSLHFQFIVSDKSDPLRQAMWILEKSAKEFPEQNAFPRWISTHVDLCIFHAKEIHQAPILHYMR